jgi:iron complex outermembrane receptor protein
VLEEITVYSTGIKQSTTKSARPVNVLIGDNLQTKVGQTLGEILQNELGVTNQSFGVGE